MIRQHTLKKDRNLPRYALSNGRPYREDVRNRNCIIDHFPFFHFGMYHDILISFDYLMHTIEASCCTRIANKNYWSSSKPYRLVVFLNSLINGSFHRFIGI